VKRGWETQSALSFINASKVRGNIVEVLLRIRLTTLEMADHPTDGDREDDAQDWQHETGSNSVPPKRITNRELWTPPIDHKR
jgi:hypothetical protein